MTSAIDNVQAVIDTARQATQPSQVEPGSIYLVSTPHGVERVDLTGDEYRDTPRRKGGTVSVRDVDSFLHYWGKHSDTGSEVYADKDGRRITAVLDAHTADGARFGKHRLVLALKHTAAFTAWAEASGKYMPQTRFAEFIEDHRPEIVDPPAAELLELAQTFQATTKVSFKSGTVIKSGQRQLTYVEETEAKAGAKGQLTIPDFFQLALAVFEGTTVADAVTARLRYRIDDGRLTLCFILDQLDDVVNAAFEAVVEGVVAGVQVPVLRGTPIS